MNLTEITGYRTNRDHTETLAWTVREDGLVECVHAAPNVCTACLNADERLSRDAAGDVVASLRPWEVVAGRTVRFDHSRTAL